MNDVVNFKIYNAVEKQAITRHLEPAIRQWLQDFFAHEDIVRLDVDNAYEQALYISNYFQKDTWLRAYCFEFQQGHCWILIDERSLMHVLQQLLNTEGPVDLSCKTSQTLLQHCFTTLTDNFMVQHTQPLTKTYKQLGPEMIQTGLAWVDYEIHTSHWSISLLLSPEMLNPWLTPTAEATSPNTITPLSDRKTSLAQEKIHFNANLALPEMSLADLYFIQEGDTIMLLEETEPPIELSHNQNQSIYSGKIGIYDNKLAIQLEEGMTK